MNIKILSFLFLLTAINAAFGQDQLDGKLTFRFVEISTSEYDEPTNSYKEIDSKKVKGTILINNINGTVIIEHSGNQRTFKLVGTTIEPDTFRTMFKLKENDKNYFLAEAVHYFTLIGETDRIIYSLER